MNKSYILTTDEKFDEKLYICETCHKHVYKDEIPRQSVSKKVALDSKPDDKG